MAVATACLDLEDTQQEEMARKPSCNFKSLKVFHNHDSQHSLEANCDCRNLDLEAKHNLNWRSITT